MKKIILLLLVSASCFSQTSVVRDNLSQKLNRETGQYENIHVYDTIIVRPEWQGFKNDLSANPIFRQLRPLADPNAFSTFIDYVNSGIDGKHGTENFLFYWNDMGLNLTSDQKTTINGILTKNFFAIQL